MSYKEKKLNIEKIEYKNWEIYSPKENIKLGKLILDEKYRIIKVLKDTKRNYVAIILMENKKYILKGFGSETIIPQRKIQTIFKKGEALTTLENGLEAIESGITELVKPLVAIIKKNVFMKESFLVMEYIEGRNLKTEKDIDEVIKITKKIHKLNRYHGDLNTSNFLINENGIKILDTQMKKEKNFFFKRGYDLLTLKEDLLVRSLNYLVEEKYGNFNKDIGYFAAKLLKKLKNLKFIKKIKKKKKKLREKGWRI